MAPTWSIVGGADKGGILVREGKGVGSPQCPTRLSTGAKVEELEFDAGAFRLQYKLLKGTGPPTGWISTALPGKELAVKDDVADVAPPLPKAGIEPPAFREARVARSAEKLRKRREGEKDMPMPTPPPARMEPGVLGQMQPFKRMVPKVLYEACKQNLPGHLSGMPFPHTAKQIEEFGADWLTKAFHTMKTLPEDNSVKRLVSVDPLPLSGFDTCGGSGPKAFFTVEYEKDDPQLHTRLFAKMPWDPHGKYPGVPETTPQVYRSQCSSGDGDWLEIFTSCYVEHLFPFPIPKFYFGDICRETTNFIFIVECLPFGKRGKVENGKVIEDVHREPYDMLPVCGKYQDFLLDDPAAIYMQIFRQLAQLAAWDQQGRYDDFLGPMPKFTPEQYLAHNLPGRKKLSIKRSESQKNGAQRMMEPALDFALNIAPCLFSKEALKKSNLNKFKEDVLATAPYYDDIRFYNGNSSDFMGVAHWNCQADNCFFWRDENGELDGGVLDWSGFSRPPNFVQSFLGCLLGCEADLLLEIEPRLMKCFCDEYERYGGPTLDPEELFLRWNLSFIQCASDTCRWIEMDTLREMPAPEWKDVTSRFSEKFMNTWNVRTRTTTFMNLLEYWPKKDMRAIFQNWQNGIGKPYVTDYSG